jgi:putative ABC transport system permease protein
MTARIGPVAAVQDTGSVTNASVFRSPLIASIDTNALSVQLATLGLLPAVGTRVGTGL